MAIMYMCIDCDWVGPADAGHICKNARSGMASYRPAREPETLPGIKAAEPALELIEANEPSDTERPPPPADLRACYWCGQPAVDIVHGDIPTCDSCKRRAVGKRRDR